MSLRDEKKAVCQVVCDLEKAFNSADRETIIAAAQRIAGAGRLLASRWDGRTYTMDGISRGEKHNQGTDAGAPI